MVLFCFSDIYSLPLTRSCYTPAEDKIDMSITEQFIYIENMNRKDNFSFNIGIGSYTSAGFDFSLIHYNSFETGESIPGDILFNLWHFIGEYFDGTFKTGVNLVVMIPTGPDAYTDEKCRNLSFGNNELKITPVLTLNLSSKEILIFNPSYTFREGRGEDLYSGFKLNPMNSETYESCLGLNPFYEDSFLDGENLRNDYASISAGIVTSRIYPLIIFSEVYYSSGITNCGNDDDINIEGAGVNPLLLSAGIKYFFSESFFIQISDIVDLLQNEEYIKNRAEFSLNIFF